MLQVTVSTFRRFWIGRRVYDPPKAARWLAACDAAVYRLLDLGDT
jgi:hypothetical protein